MFKNGYNMQFAGFRVYINFAAIWVFYVTSPMSMKSPGSMMMDSSA
jgi:hypothetical protein